jgi:hypothetical protein
MEPQVTDELSQICIDAALMWSRWALRRLNALAQGMPTPLINDLLGGGIFRSDLLTERLASADLAHQEPEVQRRIGVASASAPCVKHSSSVRTASKNALNVTNPKYGPHPIEKAPSKACS